MIRINTVRQNEIYSQAAYGHKKISGNIRANRNIWSNKFLIFQFTDASTTTNKKRFWGKLEIFALWGKGLYYPNKQSNSEVGAFIQGTLILATLRMILWEQSAALLLQPTLRWKISGTWISEPGFRSHPTWHQLYESYLLFGSRGFFGIQYSRPWIFGRRCFN